MTTRAGSAGILRRVSARLTGKMRPLDVTGHMPTRRAGPGLARRPDPIAAHLTGRVPVAAPSALAGHLRQALAGQRYDTSNTVAVLDGDRLAGLLRLEDLLAAPDDATAAQLMDPDPVTVLPGADQEAAALQAAYHQLPALAVADETDRFLGLVPAERLLPVLLAEHEEDLARLSGMAGDAASARRASTEPVSRRLRHRLPWLLLGLVGAVLAADLVGAFAAQLQHTVILAFFVPGIVYMADAVGTQTETLVVRGLSVGIPIRAVIRRELLTGLLVGVLLAAVFVPVGLRRWGDPAVTTVVALSLLASCSIATAVAMALPWLLHLLGRDPAFGSGPLATVVQDLLSVLIYFLIAKQVLG